MSFHRYLKSINVYIILVSIAIFQYIKKTTENNNHIQKQQDSSSNLETENKNLSQINSEFKVQVER